MVFRDTSSFHELPSPTLTTFFLVGCLLGCFLQGIIQGNSGGFTGIVEKVIRRCRGFITRGSFNGLVVDELFCELRAWKHATLPPHAANFYILTYITAKLWYLVNTWYCIALPACTPVCCAVCVQEQFAVQKGCVHLRVKAATMRW